MRLKRLTVKNFCQHIERELEFPSSGILVVQGPNGVGKSNLVRALQFAITGRVPDKANKSAAISWGASDGLVSLTCETDAGEFEIIRHLASTKTVLVTPDKRFGKSSEASEEIEKLMSCTAAVLDKFVILRQGQLLTALTATPGERQKLLNRLFGLDQVEKARQELQSEQNTWAAHTRLDISPEMVMADIEVNNRSIESVRDRAAVLKVRIEQLTPQVATFQTMTRLRDMVMDPTTGHSITTSRIRDTVLALDQMVEDLDVATKNLTTAQQQRAALEAQASQAEAKIKQADAYQHAARQRDSLTSVIREAERKLQSLVPPDDGLNVTQADLEALITKRAVLAQRQKEAERFIERFSSGVCPTCGTSVITDHNGEQCQIESKSATWKEQLQSINAAYKSANEDVKLYQDALSAWQAGQAQYERDKTKYTADLESSKRQLDALNVPEAVPDVEHYRAILDSMRHYQIRVAELTTKVGSLQHHVNTLSKQREALNEQKIRLDEAAKQIKNYPFTEGASYATELRSAEGECNQAVGQLIELESHHKRLQIQHAEAVTKAAAASAAVRWLNDLEVVKTVFGRDNLQTELAKVFFNTINTNWNQVLADMDLPFSVAFTDDMDIRLEFENNRNASILDASGGQQTCAALALMLAVNRTFAHEVGFLILDEPTYGVDQDHINNVISVLTKAGEFAENTGLQILVITHEPKIAQAFEHSYVLEAQ